MIVITGCAHPGIVEITERAKSIFNKEILLVLGGFHLQAAPVENIKNIASRLRELGVKYVAPVHCSGPYAREVFSKTSGIKYLDCGVGKIITARDLN